MANGSFLLAVLLGGCLLPEGLEGGPVSRAKRTTSTCYGGECFSSDAPFNNTDGILPQDPDFIRTTFRLFTKRGGSRPVIIAPEVGHVPEFDSQLPTRFIIHGFLQHAQVSWVTEMMTELQKWDSMNVITVDWGRGSGFPYSQAAANTRLVGAQVAQMITFLNENFQLPLSNVHLIGHSLGAHVAGYAGARTPGLGRITGLDPAEPEYEGTPPAVRLDPTDAAFVDIIHTDGSEFDYVSGYGMIDEVGHIDFYPNGGMDQPGCVVDNVENIVSTAYYKGLQDAEDTVSCSHSRSIRLFTESINSRCPFQGFRCPSLAALDNNLHDCMRCPRGGCPIMGFHADRTSQTGKFYLRTRASHPFCGYSQHVEVEFGPDMASTTGNIRVQLLTDDQSSDYIDINGNRRVFRAGQVTDKLWMDSQTLDDISQLKLTFTRSGGYLRWLPSLHGSPRSISVAMVAVTSAQTGRRVFFCGDNETVANGNTITLTRSTTDPQECGRLGGDLIQAGRNQDTAQIL